jgi:hypothetical protein
MTFIEYSSAKYDGMSACKTAFAVYRFVIFLLYGEDRAVGVLFDYSGAFLE